MHQADLQIHRLNRDCHAAPRGALRWHQLMTPDSSHPLHALQAGDGFPGTVQELGHQGMAVVELQQPETEGTQTPHWHWRLHHEHR